ncbi:hypothetical protein BDV12DRAFT_1628 [Aspergillus spectabilis]
MLVYRKQSVDRNILSISIAIGTFLSLIHQFAGAQINTTALSTTKWLHSNIPTG